MTTLHEKLTKSVNRALSKGSIKAHARAIPQSIKLNSETVSITVDGHICTLSVSNHSASFPLTSHWKSGSLYAHWIRLNKALIELDSLVCRTPNKEELAEAFGKSFLERLVAKGKVRPTQTIYKGK
ncbi:hypothetical protein [Vibrio sp. 10N.222.55.C7]|uniref:hypothetical protein n=1 Tax=Vibrio sp. 10N.222.55.C7 TaxID=3229650 RepID=UPI0035507966